MLGARSGPDRLSLPDGRRAVPASLASVFWTTQTLINILVAVQMVLMAYSVAYYGISYPDRVVKEPTVPVDPAGTGGAVDRPGGHGRINRIA
jgi:hypothetical protein